MLWDLPKGAADTAEVLALAAAHGLRPGSINPNTFQDQIYKYGSLGNPDPETRRAALDHILASIEIAASSSGPPQVAPKPKLYVPQLITADRAARW